MGFGSSSSSPSPPSPSPPSPSPPPSPLPSPSPSPSPAQPKLKFHRFIIRLAISLPSFHRACLPGGWWVVGGWLWVVGSVVWDPTTPKRPQNDPQPPPTTSQSTLQESSPKPPESGLQCALEVVGGWLGSKAHCNHPQKHTVGVRPRGCRSQAHSVVWVLNTSQPPKSTLQPPQNTLQPPILGSKAHCESTLRSPGAKALNA